MPFACTVGMPTPFVRQLVHRPSGGPGREEFRARCAFFRPTDRGRTKTAPRYSVWVVPLGAAVEKAPPCPVGHAAWSARAIAPPRLAGFSTGAVVFPAHLPGQGMVTTGRCPRLVVPALATANGPPYGAVGPVSSHRLGRFFSNGREQARTGGSVALVTRSNTFRGHCPREFAAPTHRKQRGTPKRTHLPPTRPGTEGSGGSGPQAPPSSWSRISGSGFRT